MSLRALLAALACVLLLGGCAGDGPDDKSLPYVERSAEQIYTEALERLDRRQYRVAAALFNEVERQHPYSVWSQRAQLMAAYSYYLGLRYQEAVEQIDRFLEISPASPQAAYAYYLKAVAYYEQIADIRRDQTATQNALNGLQEVVDRFPGTAYARDAQLKIDLARDHLAGREMEVGRFYQGRLQWHAAIRRFQIVVNNYQTTGHVPEALHRLVESYMALGLMEDARRVGSWLGYNYPGSSWYADTYALLEGDVAPDDQENLTFFDRAWRSLF